MERWIYFRYPNEPKKRAALEQVERAISSALLDAGEKATREEVNQGAENNSKATECVYAVCLCVTKRLAA